MNSDTQVIHLTIPLAPRHMGNETNAIKWKLDRMKLKSLPNYDGILTKWTNLEVLDDVGLIIDEQPYSFWRVKFEGTLFNPEKGKIINVTIQRLFSGYAVAKVYDGVSVTVTIPDRLKETQFCKGLLVGQEIYCCVSDARIGENDIRAEIDEECIRLAENDLQFAATTSDVYGAYELEY